MRVRNIVMLFALISSVSADSFCSEPPEISQLLRTITIEPGQTVSDVQGYLCPIVVNGTVAGDVIAVGGDITIAGTVEGDAVALGGGIHILSQGHVDGDTTALGGPVRVENTAKAGGDTDSLPYMHLPGQRRPYAIGVLTFVSANLALLLLAALIFRRRRAQNLSSAVTQHPVMVISLGVLFSVLILSLYWVSEAFKRFSLAWLLTVSAVAFFTYLAGYIGLAATIGRVVARGRGWITGALIGVGVLNVMLLVPIVGLILFLAAIVLSGGNPIASGFGRDPDWLAGLLRKKTSPGEAKPSLP